MQGATCALFRSETENARWSQLVKSRCLGKITSLFAKKQLNAKVSSHVAVVFHQRSQQRNSLTQTSFCAAQLQVVSSANALKCVSVVSYCMKMGPTLSAGSYRKAFATVSSEAASECRQSTTTNYKMVTSPFKQHTWRHRPRHARNAIRSLEMLLSERRLKRLQLFSLER